MIPNVWERIELHWSIYYNIVYIVQYIHLYSNYGFPRHHEIMWFSQLPRHGQAKPGALPAALRLVASVVAAAGSRFGPGVQATLTRTKGGPGAGQMVAPKTEHPNREKLFAEIPWETITWIKWIQFGWPGLRPQKQIPLRIPCQESCIPELPRMSGVSWYTLSMVSRWKTVSERNFNSSGNRI